MIYCVISIPAEKARDIRNTFFELCDTAKIREQNTQGYKHCNVSENLYQPKIPQILDAYVLQKGFAPPRRAQAQPDVLPTVGLKV